MDAATRTGVSVPIPSPADIVSCLQNDGRKACRPQLVQQIKPGKTRSNDNCVEMIDGSFDFSHWSTDHLITSLYVSAPIGSFAVTSTGPEGDQLGTSTWNAPCSWPYQDCVPRRAPETTICD